MRHCKATNASPHTGREREREKEVDGEENERERKSKNGIEKDFQFSSIQWIRNFIWLHVEREMHARAKMEPYLASSSSTNVCN